MADITLIHISSLATQVAERFQNELLFPNALSAAKFGMSYALLNYSESDIVKWLSDTNDPRFDSKGNTYQSGFADSSSIIKVITSIFPNCSTPLNYIRVLMDIGLIDLGEKISDLGSLNKFLSEELNLKD